MLCRIYFFLTALILICSFPTKIPYAKLSQTGTSEAQKPETTRTLPLYGSGGLNLLTFAANNPNWCLSVQLSIIFVAVGTSALMWDGMGTKTEWEKPSFMFNLFPLSPFVVPRGSSSNAARYPTPTKNSGTLNPSVIPTIALLIRVLVRPHILRCFFWVASSTERATTPFSAGVRCMYDSSGTEAAPSGPTTSSFVGVMLRVTDGGTGMGVFPMWEVYPLAARVEEKERTALCTTAVRGSIQSKYAFLFRKILQLLRLGPSPVQGSRQFLARRNSQANPPSQSFF